MLGWELPPHNSGGLGVACYQLGEALSERDDIDLEFVLPYKLDADIDFMKVTAATTLEPEIVMAGLGAYDSQAYEPTEAEDGAEVPTERYDIYSQTTMFEQAVAKLAPKFDFDIVHAHDWLTFRAALRLKEHTGRPIVLHIHALESDRAGGNRGNQFVHDVEAEALAQADQVVAVSAFTKTAICREYGISPNKITVIHNSLNWQQMEPVDPGNSYYYLEQMKSLGWRVVVNMGRLTTQKGLTNLMRAAVQVLRRAPKTMFLIVGSGEQYHELAQMGADLGIGQNVLFAPFQRGKRWRDAFAVADLFVMPSVSEPFGLTPLEATVYGAPSLITYQSGVSEVLENSLKVDFWDIDKMADLIVHALEHDTLRGELVERARQELYAQSWRRSADQFAELYRRLLSRRVAAAV